MRTLKRRQGIRIVRTLLIVVTIIMAILVHLLDARLLPALTAVAQNRAKILATQAIVEAIVTQEPGNLSYNNLIVVHTDRQGRPAWAEVNTLEVNRLIQATTTRVIQILEGLRGETVDIPLGIAFGSPILANFGPGVSFYLLPVGAVNVEIVDAFETAGINQTRHKIYLQVYTQVQVVIPFVSEKVEVRSQVPIADVTYLGEVPQAVFNLPFPLATGLGWPPVGERPPLPSPP